MKLFMKRLKIFWFHALENVNMNAKKNVETIVIIHVELEANVKMNAKKNVRGDNCKDPC